MPSCLDVSNRNDILERAMSAPGTSHGPVSLEASYCEQASKRERAGESEKERGMVQARRQTMLKP